MSMRRSRPTRDRRSRVWAWLSLARRSRPARDRRSRVWAWLSLQSKSLAERRSRPARDRRSRVWAWLSLRHQTRRRCLYSAPGVPVGRQAWLRYTPAASVFGPGRAGREASVVAIHAGGAFFQHQACRRGRTRKKSGKQAKYVSGRGKSASSSYLQCNAIRLAPAPTLKELVIGATSV